MRRITVQKFMVALLLVVISTVVFSVAHAAERRMISGNEEASGGTTQDLSDQRLSFSLIGQRMVAYVTNVINAIKRSEGLADAERQRILEQLSKDLQNIQTDTLTLGKTQTLSDLRTRVDALRQYWVSKENRMKYYISIMLAGRVRQTIERFKLIEVKIDMLVHRAATDPPNDELQKLKDTFSDELKQAQENHQLAVQEFSKLETSANANEIFTSGHEYLKKAHTHLQKARETLHTLLTTIRQLLPQQPSTIPSTTPIQP